MCTVQLNWSLKCHLLDKFRHMGWRYFDLKKVGGKEKNDINAIWEMLFPAYSIFHIKGLNLHIHVLHVNTLKDRCTIHLPPTCVKLLLASNRLQFIQ